MTIRVRISRSKEGGSWFLFNYFLSKNIKSAFCGFKLDLQFNSLFLAMEVSRDKGLRREI